MPTTTVDLSGNRRDISGNIRDISGNKPTVTFSPRPSPNLEHDNDGIFDRLFSSLSSIFTFGNVFLFVCFLAIYFVIFLLIKAFYRNGTDPLKEKLAFSRSIDMFLFGLIIVLIVYFYYTLSEADKRDLISYGLVTTRDFFDNPNTLFNLSIFIVVFYCFIYLCGVPMTKETRPLSIYFIEQKLWVLLLIVGFFDFFKYILGIHIVDFIFGSEHGLINDWYKIKTEINEEIHETPESEHTHAAKKAEVFNISNNLYTYDDAQSVCQAFDSRLATVDEINQAYLDGAEWCVNSWSADKQVLFPTQQKTYDKLQGIKGSENSCGRTGVNGGRIENTNLRFGVNCFGVKPAPTDNEKNRMNDINNFVHPKTKEEMITDAKVNFWKNNRDKYIVLNPFNDTKWNEY
jgi:hypothetical protein